MSRRTDMVDMVLQMDKVEAKVLRCLAAAGAMLLPADIKLYLIKIGTRSTWVQNVGILEEALDLALLHPCHINPAALIIPITVSTVYL